MRHESTFFELAASLTVEVKFIVSAEQAQKLLQQVRAAGIRAFYACAPAVLGVINPTPAIRTRLESAALDGVQRHGR